MRLIGKKVAFPLIFLSALASFALFHSEYTKMARKEGLIAPNADFKTLIPAACEKPKKAIHIHAVGRSWYPDVVCLLLIARYRF